MKHGAFLVTKFIAYFVTLSVILGWLTNFSWENLALLSGVLAVVAFLGDVILLPKLNNTVATLADMGMALLIIGFAGNRLLSMDLTLINISYFLIAAVVIGVVEWIAHGYYQRMVLKRPL
ncbi:hypothetical protein GCM10007416_11730 [Kroppenstedtia guangzhouensis]|jgi:Protein of unknown function (DUF2512)|uniref:4 TMS phage holin, superfamily IV n=1 Tax=Kroppenstedtia guangzhouensis TaxID=1274356 RepID=A0ABQ1GBG3_9BACL|nr:DUF2512 family protein [Kroppenstedtia guangzhouensis]GGA40401.1 hypothetical protein GCM10007416_11730 [Kroppenstedtia guangzhouensis]